MSCANWHRPVVTQELCSAHTTPSATGTTWTTPKAAPAEAENVIEFDDFARVKLAVAEVVAAAKVEKADRLLKLKVKVGTEERQLVAGIAEHYQPDELIGRRIVVVTNLKPRKLMGLESRGMLLAARHGKTLALLTTDAEIPAGAEIS